ncbi:MAG: hypothetical protein KBS52_03790 [Clostridiales bacterium]|nr:hypothetical protein [Candidatus Equinaster intestinalis]
MNLSPEQIAGEYNTAQLYKDSIGSYGIREQAKINERFFVGNQWYGANCGNSRPLVRHNVIKRIGDYKMSALLSDNVEVRFSAEGVPNTVKNRKAVTEIRKNAALGNNVLSDLNSEEKISFVMEALNDYRRTTAHRVKFDSLLCTALKNAYISGTGVIYTYWDDSIETGLYADDAKTTPIKGDIVCETIPIENLCFGDPRETDLQKQPFIILSGNYSGEEVLEQVKRFSPQNVDRFTESAEYKDGRVTLLTKLFKEYDKNGVASVYAVRTAAGVTVREKWNIGVRRYPLAVFCWETRPDCAYGHSEITYLIPNQIAINRMTTAKVWSVMSSGMPLLLVNGDIVDGDITNDPGQIIKVYGTAEDTENAVKYVSPPSDNLGYADIIEPLIDNTLSASGANAAALGDVAPNNTSAIIELQNAARLPLITLKKRYFAFLEEISGIWAEFWIRVYGNRKLKQVDENGVWYFDFSGKEYENLVLCAEADVYSDTVLSTKDTIELLDKLFDKGIITASQYLKRLPKGTVQSLNELIISGKED